MTNLKPQSVLTAGAAVGDTTPALTITFNATHPPGQTALTTTDFNNAPIMGIGDLVNGTVYFPSGAYNSVFDTHGMRITNDNTANPQSFYFPDGNSQGMNLWAGTGVPSGTTIGGAAQLGDLYSRRDGTAGSYLYRCTAAGSPGTWVAVL